MLSCVYVARLICSNEVCADQPAPDAATRAAGATKAV